MGDTRLGERWTSAQQRKNDRIFAAARAALWLACRLPAPLLRAACALLGLLCWAALGRERRRTQRNLAVAFGPRSPGSLRVFLALASSLEDTLALLRGGPALGPRLRFPDGALAVFREALNEGRGVVLATAHLGPWERMGAGLIEAGLPAVTVARASYDPRFQSIYQRLREARGLRVLYRGNPGFVAALRRALKANQVVGMPMDLGGRGVRTAAVPWFGSSLPLALGPAELAHRTGAALIFATVAPAPGGLEVRASRVSLGENSEETTRTIGAHLEGHLRALPLPWPWMHPEPSPSLLPLRAEDR